MASTAAPLDDATLRRVFANAQDDVTMPASTSALRKLRMRRLWARHTTLFVVLLGVTIVAAFVALVAGAPVMSAAALGLALVAWLIVWGVQASRATTDYLTRYASTRGLNLAEDAAVSASVPLFGRGDKREYERRFTGTIAGCPSALSHYTYTEVSTDSEGRRTETDHDYTTLEFPLPAAVAARFAGVYLSPSKWSFGTLQDKLSHDHRVELESVAFAKRYTLRVRDEQDEVALYELFSTTFIDRLSTELEVHWEQVGAALVLYRRKHEMDANDLDRFCLESWHVLQRYLEEHQ
ncbi:MAG: hypothetical protein H7287_01780 [Thermoleophilia bacterium]|nr:hypothetical protein [Thermoleophilia bacterium]